MAHVHRLVLASLLSTSLIGCGGSGSKDNNNDNTQEAAMCSQDTFSGTDVDRDWTCIPSSLQGKLVANNVIQSGMSCATSINGNGDVTITISGTPSGSLTISNSNAKQHSSYTSQNDQDTYRVWIGDSTFEAAESRIEFQSPPNSSKVYVEAVPVPSSDGQSYRATCIMDLTEQGGGNTGPVISRQEFLERYTTSVLMQDGTWARLTNDLALKAFGLEIGTPAAYVDTDKLRFLPGAEGTITAPR